MSRDILSGVVFTPASRTLDFSNVVGFDTRQLRTVIHGPTNAPIYLLGGSKAFGGVWAGKVLTLAADLTGMVAGDSLTITLADEGTRFYTDQTNLNVAANQQIVGLLRYVGDSSRFKTFITGGFSSQTGGKLQVYQSQDATGGTQFITNSVDVPAGGGFIPPVIAPLLCPYVRAVFSNSTTATTISLSSALHA